MQGQSQTERGNWKTLIHVCSGQKEKQVGTDLTASINRFIIFILQVTKCLCNYLEHIFITVTGAEIL